MTWLRRCRRRRVGIGAEWRHALVGHRWPRPAAAHRTGTGTDWARTRGQLLAENALLRQQLLVVHHSITRPTLTPADRALLVLLAGRVRASRQALLLVQPETLLRWHRAGFRALRRRKSCPGPGRPPLQAETIALIRRMAADNPLWGAKRICGELGKLGIRVAKGTIQTYRRGHRAPRPRGQTWATFLRNHAPDIWACDFLPVTDRLFRPLFACCIIEQATRRVGHVGATRHPTDAWVAQQLREATPFDQRPRYLIRDHDGKFGAAFASVAAASGITILRTPPRAPQANAVSERCLGSVRRACLDHPLVLGERRRSRVLRAYVAYCNRARPHRGLGQALPEPPPEQTARCAGPLRAVPVLGGLHHT
jgi:putative transposase